MLSTKPLRRFARKQLDRLEDTKQTKFELSTEFKAKKNWTSSKEVAEYRKTIKVYDIFTFFNELDLLEIRLNILDPYVDYFVIVEATEAFSGSPKPLYYAVNKARFAKWNHKIIHHVVNDVPRDDAELRERLIDPNLNALDKEIVNNTLTTDNIDRKYVHWTKEFYIKESAKKALVGLNDNDICYISDLDEIWNPELFIDFTKDEIWKPVQKGYIYYLNNRTSENHWKGWTGTVVTKYKNIRLGCLNHLRTHKKMLKKYVFLQDGGWHFTFMGGFEGAKKKIDESNNPDYYSQEVITNLEKRVTENKDWRNKTFKIRVDEKGLPKYLLANREKYKRLFK